MTITQRGAAEAQQHLGDVADRLRDLRPILNVIGADTVTLTDDSFRNARSPDGNAWAPLAPSTIARRRGSVASPLVDTGHLRSSITFSAQPRTLRFGTNVTYSGPLQFGTRRMPARPFMPVTKAGASVVLMTGGAAGRHWDEARESIHRYIATGEIS